MNPAVITNHDLSPEWWVRNYSEEDLNKKAKEWSIPIAEHKEQTAVNLQSGLTISGKGTMTIAMAYPDHKCADYSSVCPE